MKLPREFTLVSEFAAVSVAVVEIDRRPMLAVTDLGSGQTAQLDPGEALSDTADTPVPASVELDLVANGPRLKISRVGGAAVYLDALQLADAAVTGCWGKFPPAYDVEA